MTVHHLSGANGTRVTSTVTQCVALPTGAARYLWLFEAMPHSAAGTSCYPPVNQFGDDVYGGSFSFETFVQGKWGFDSPIRHAQTVIDFNLFNFYRNFVIGFHGTAKLTSLC